MNMGGIAPLLTATSGTTAAAAPPDVTLASYIGLPALAGAVAVVLFLLSLLFIRTYTWEKQKQNLLSRDWWGHPISGSGAWTLSDSWATNISTGLVVIGTILSTESAVTTNTLFPGIMLDRFAIVFIVAGAIVAAAPLAFGISYSIFTARNPGPAADSTISLPRGQAVTISVPSGASVTMTADAEVQNGEAQRVKVRAGCTYQIPPGAEIEVQQGARAIEKVIAKATSENPAIENIAEQVNANIDCQPSHTAPVISFAGTSDIGTLPGTTLTLNSGALGWTIASGDRVAAATGAAANGQGDVLVAFPAKVIADGGTRITVTGTADVKLPKDAVISGPRRTDSDPLPKDKWLQVPQGANVIVANMAMLVIANVITMFGIGAELGVAFVLTDLSAATGPWPYVIYAALGVQSLFLLWYAYTATLAMANPQPGSATSAQAGTSFTL
jgi:hypothetical protein